MRSESVRVFRAAALSVVMLGFAGCGILGKKTDLNQLLNYNPQAVGCMNQIGPNVKAYYQGTIDAATWGATWDCATTNLDLFKQFVHASDPSGFTRGDIQSFVSGFLITNQTITPELIGALFELKASLFGGTKDIIAPAEIDAVNNFLGVLKVQTTQLLPFMVTRVTDASPANLLALTDAIVAAGNGIAAGLNTSGNPTFSFSSAQTLVDQLATILNIAMPPDLVAWLSAVKVVITAGATDGIAAGDWPHVIQAIVSYGGPALAVFSVDPNYLTGPNAVGQFGMKLAWKIKTNLLQTLDLYGGALPLTALDSVIDALPAAWLTIDRTAIKGALRPLANKLLMSHVPNAIDSSAIDLVFDKVDYWNRRQTHLESIFDMINPSANGVTYEIFEAAVQSYLPTVPATEAPVVNDLLSLVRQYRPMFVGSDTQMMFTPNDSYSLNDLTTFNWVTLAAMQVVKAYSTVPGGLVGVQADLETLVSDFTALARALHASDLSVPGWADARFLEANLFTYASNGDTYIDYNEATYLVAMAYSSGQLSTRIRLGTDAVCPAVMGENGSTQDVLGHNWKSADCFRSELFGNYKIYWDHEPLLVQFYQRLSLADQTSLQQAMEKAARRYGISEQPVASADQDGFAGITQYIETLLTRFDVNNDQHLDLTEANTAYPVFKGPLAQLGGLTSDPDWIIKSVFTYVLKYGHPPTKDVGGILSLVAWIAITPTWSIDADRLKLYQVVSSIVTPQPLPGSTPTPSASPQVDRSITELANDLGIPLTGGLSAAFSMPMPLASGL